MPHRLSMEFYSQPRCSNTNEPRTGGSVALKSVFAMLRSTFVLGAVVLSLIGCDSSPFDSCCVERLGDLPHALFPNEIGTTWVFDRFYTPGVVSYDTSWAYAGFSSFGIDPYDQGLDRVLFTTRLEEVRDLVVDDTLYRSFVINNGFRYFYHFATDGVYSLGMEDDRGQTILRKSLYLPAVISADSSWAGLFFGRQGGILIAKQVFQRHLIAEEEAIVTPAGEFQAVVVQMMVEEADDYPGYLTRYEYLAPGIGVVAVVRTFDVPGFYQSVEYIDLLRSYSTADD